MLHTGAPTGASRHPDTLLCSPAKNVNPEGGPGLGRWNKSWWQQVTLGSTEWTAHGGFRNSTAAKAQGVGQVSPARWEGVRLSSKDSAVVRLGSDLATHQLSHLETEQTHLTRAGAGLPFYRHRTQPPPPKSGHSGSFPTTQEDARMCFSLDASGHCLWLSQPERELTVEEIQSKLQAVSK